VRDLPRVLGRNVTGRAREWHVADLLDEGASGDIVDRILAFIGR
jgi:hypothetical protein